MKILSIVFTILCINTSSKVIGVDEIRKSYQHCNESKENAEQFFELTKKGLQNNEAIYKGYHGAALALKAAHSWNPFNKMSYFNKGKKMIDNAIVSEPDNIELRMIRLSIQSNTPKIVGYYKNIEEDRDFMLKNIKGVSSKGLKQYIEGYMSYSEVFSKP